MAGNCSAENNGAIKLWDLERGTLLWTIWQTNNIYCIAFAPNGQMLASGGDDAAIRLWDADRGTPLQTLTGHSGPVFTLTWSPDGSLLASGGFDTQIRLWERQNTRPGTGMRMLTGHTNWVYTLAFAPDGRTLASGGGGKGELFVWDASSGERLYSLSESSEVVNALAWSPTGAVLVSGGSDGMLRWWDLQHGECVRMQRGHQGAIQSLKRSPDGRLLASCGDDGAIQVWDLASGEPLRTLLRDRPYERLDIGGVQGLSEAQRASLRALGAIEDDIRASESYRSSREVPQL